MTGFLSTAVKGRNPFVLQIASVAAIGGFLFGYDTGVISGALLFIKKDLGASTAAQQWIVAVLLLGAIGGAVIAGYLADRISRRWTKAISGAVYVIAALGSAFAQDVPELIVARFVLGLSVGCASFVSPMYIAEQTPPKIRGGVVSFNQLMIVSGILCAYIADWALKGVAGNWRWMLGLAALPGLALLVGMFFVPYSPRWLVEKGRTEEAKDVLQKTRPKDEVADELQDIEQVVDEQRQVRLTDLFRGRIRALVVVGLGLAIFQQLVGVNTVIYYSPTILSFTGLQANAAVTQALTIGIVNVVFTVVAVLLLDRVGRRPLLLIGTIGLTIALIVLGLFFQLPALRHDAPWVALVALLAFMASFAVGLGPVFWLMISEIYPLKYRSRAMAVSTVANWAANFLVSYFFLSFVGWVGKPGTFWIYAGLGAAAVAFFWWRVPETKGRSLEDVEREVIGNAYPAGGHATTAARERQHHSRQ
ncbi:MAG TPA: sugar porter family MFS transporter [Mycobacteriales bacterium]|nr:sugar porter family MFS transporter [Mycobacteriales bacterium]